jgi:hypothetical protein
LWTLIAKTAAAEKLAEAHRRAPRIGEIDRELKPPSWL